MKVDLLSIWCSVNRSLHFNVSWQHWEALTPQERLWDIVSRCSGQDRRDISLQIFIKNYMNHVYLLSAHEGHVLSFIAIKISTPLLYLTLLCRGVRLRRMHCSLFSLCFPMSGKYWIMLMFIVRHLRNILSLQFAQIIVDRQLDWISIVSHYLYEIW